MNGTPKITEYVFDWLFRAVPIWRLRPDDVRGQKRQRKAVVVLFVGVLVAAIAETIVVMGFNPKTPVAQIFELPIIGLSNLLGAACFLGLFLLFFSLLRPRIDIAPVACLACYVLSGLVPILVALSSEQLIEAIKLFLKYNDPSLPYLSGATIRLLFPEEATISATARAWFFMISEVFVFAFYLWMLGRLIARSMPGHHAPLKVTFALVLATITNGLLMYFLLGRVYWWMMGIMLTGSR